MLGQRPHPEEDQQQENPQQQQSTENTKEETNEPPRKKSKKESYRRGGKRNNKRSSNSTPSDSNHSDDKWLQESEKANKLFTAYYRLNLMQEQDPRIKSEEEWEKFYSVLKSKLPITFRINMSNPEFAQAICDRIQKFYIPKLEKATAPVALLEFIREPIPAELVMEDPVTKEKVVPLNPPRAVSWFNNGMFWHVPASKALLRKQPDLNDFRKYLMSLNARGFISRQELVSMLPPMFFDMEPHDRILDMCAAPGSKTAQLMELLYQSSKKQNKPMTGFVVANDNDVQRCYLLIKQLQRLNNIFPSVIVTNHDALLFPKLIYKDENQLKHEVKFTKILCDVMCSGDGTLRKNPDLWTRWEPGLGRSVHNFQINCVMRAFALLEVGGTIVYSTCSLNPIEDEAVVAAVLKRSKGTLQLVDATQRYPNLNYSPGMYSWSLMDKLGNVIRSMQDVTPRSGTFTETMFPPSLEEAKAMNLQYCMRILPHVADTGGFFVAVLKKVAESQNQLRNQHKLEMENESILKSKDEDVEMAEQKEESSTSSTAAAPSNEKIKKFQGRSTNFEELVKHCDDSVIQQISTFYGIDAALLKKILYIRTDSTKDESKNSRKIYAIAESLQPIVDENTVSKQWNILSVGLRVFEYSPATFINCDYRITQEGAELLYPHIAPKRILKMHRKDFCNFLTHETMSHDALEDVNLKQQLKEMETGGLIAVLQREKSEEEDATTSDIIVCGMKTVNNLMRLARKELATSLLHIINKEEVEGEF